MKKFLPLSGTILILAALLVMAGDWISSSVSSKAISVPIVQPCGACEDIDGEYYKQYKYRIETSKWIINEQDGQPREVIEVTVIPPETCGQVLYFPKCEDGECFIEFDGMVSILFAIDSEFDGYGVSLTNKGDGELFEGEWTIVGIMNRKSTITGEFLIRHRPVEDKSAVENNNEIQED